MSYYMRMDGGDERFMGGTVLRAGQRWYEISSFSFGNTSSAATTATGAKGENAKAALSKSLVITMAVTANTPSLFRFANQVSSLGTVIIEATQGAGKTEGVSTRITLTDVLISSAQLSSQHGDDGQMSSLALSFAKSTFEQPAA